MMFPILILGKIKGNIARDSRAAANFHFKQAVTPRESSDQMIPEQYSFGELLQKNNSRHGL